MLTNCLTCDGHGCVICSTKQAAALPAITVREIISLGDLPESAWAL